MKAWYGLIIAAGFAQTAAAACSLPLAPGPLPDGATATLEQMLSGQQAVKEYDQRVNEYLSCLKGDYETFASLNADKLNEQQKQELEALAIMKNNAAVAAAEDYAAKFNEQLKIFKARKTS